MQSIDRDGVRLCYVADAGEGPPVVLIHGWCCDHSYLDPQRAHFARRGHRVVAVDLRGHGGSDRPVQAYTMGDFADDVAWLSSRLSVENAIVIGHSMGGIVAYELAGRHPDLVSAFVMIDATVTRLAASRDAIAGIIEQLRTPDYGEVIRRYVETALLLPSDDPDRRREILADMAKASQHVAVSAMEGLRDYDPETLAGAIVAPALYIAADEMPPRTDIWRLRDLLPQLAFGQTVGSGHFCQLEVPDQVNAMIDRFLAIQAASSRSARPA
jgi:pimeloyl-ACP methyl ester carboxylesterase